MRSIAFLFVLALGMPLFALEQQLVTPAGSIPLPGVKGRIDHLAIDSQGKRLFVAALGNDTIEVVDLLKDKRTQSMKVFREPQGVAWLDDLAMLVVACGEGKVLLYDNNLKRLETLNDLDDADNVRYDAAAKRVYVACNTRLEVIDPVQRKRVTSILLTRRAQAFQIERNTARIFVNVPQLNQIVVMDREKQTTTSAWPIGDAKGNFPMALDEENQRLYVPCRGPAKLLVIDSKAGNIITSLDCAGDADDVFFDRAGSMIYISGGEGYITGIRMIDRDHYEVAGKVRTADGARTCKLDEEARRLYLAVPERENHGAEIRIFDLPHR